VNAGKHIILKRKKKKVSISINLDRQRSSSIMFIEPSRAFF